jgi:hypothetical protein
MFELNHRYSGGIEIVMLWNERDNRVVIEISDPAQDSVASFDVSPEKASDAFQHPYAYLTAHPGNSYPVAA